MGDRYAPSLFLFIFLLPFSPPLACREAAPWNQLGGLRELCNSPNAVWGFSPAAYTFWCMLSLKIAPGGNIFHKCPRKNSCIGKKCRNNVQNLHQQKISGDIYIFRGNFPLPRYPAVYLEETLQLMKNTINTKTKVKQTDKHSRIMQLTLTNLEFHV